MLNKKAKFSEHLLMWFAQNGRKDLPWQQNPTTYRVWVSEIMLQQTQVATVIPYFNRFMQQFPDVESLAGASQDDVLKYWSGLGYYARARNLHRAAQQLKREYASQFPADLDSLMSLPGIGRSTAAAIMALACGQRGVILDGNVKRVLTRYHAIDGWPGKRVVAEQLWALAEEHTPHQQVAEYTQAIMDLGATLCTRIKPGCESCPLQGDCLAFTAGNPQAFPQPKPKTKRPVRTARFLILQNRQGEVLLRKRPDHGVWGGLWSFPELPDHLSLDEYFQAQDLRVLEKQKNLAAFKHQFTHFELHIEPLLIQAEANANGVREIEEQLEVWYKTGTELPGGCPAPVIQLLNQIEESNS